MALVHLKRAKGLQDRTEVCGYQKVELLSVFPTWIAKREHGMDLCTTALVITTDADGHRELTRIGVEDLMHDVENEFLVLDEPPKAVATVRKKRTRRRNGSV